MRLSTIEVMIDGVSRRIELARTAVCDFDKFNNSVDDGFVELTEAALRLPDTEFAKIQDRIIELGYRWLRADYFI